MIKTSCQFTAVHWVTLKSSQYFSLSKARYPENVHRTPAENQEDYLHYIFAFLLRGYTFKETQFLLYSRICRVYLSVLIWELGKKPLILQLGASPQVSSFHLDLFVFLAFSTILILKITRFPFVSVRVQSEELNQWDSYYRKWLMEVGGLTK